MVPASQQLMQHASTLWPCMWGVQQGHKPEQCAPEMRASTAEEQSSPKRSQHAGRTSVCVARPGPAYPHRSAFLLKPHQFAVPQTFACRYRQLIRNRAACPAGPARAQRLYALCSGAQSVCAGGSGARGTRRCLLGGLALLVCSPLELLGPPRACAAGRLKSRASDVPCVLRLVNASGEWVKLYWLNYDGMLLRNAATATHRSAEFGTADYSKHLRR